MSLPFRFAPPVYGQVYFAQVPYAGYGVATEVPIPQVIPWPVGAWQPHDEWYLKKPKWAEDEEEDEEAIELLALMGTDL